MDKIAKTHQTRVDALYKSLKKKYEQVQTLETDILLARNSPHEYIECLGNVKAQLKLASRALRPVVSDDELDW